MAKSTFAMKQIFMESIERSRAWDGYGAGQAHARDRPLQRNLIFLGIEHDLLAAPRLTTQIYAVFQSNARALGAKPTPDCPRDGTDIAGVLLALSRRSDISSYLTPP